MNKIITKCLRNGKVTHIFKMPQKLLNDFELKFVAWIKEYVQKYGVAPTLERFQKEFVYFFPDDSSDPIEDIFQDELKRKKNLYLKTIISKNHESINEGLDPTELVEDLHKTFQTGEGLILSTAGIDRTSYFEPRKIFSFDVPFIDRSTGGLAGGDLIYIVGRPGSNKTTFSEWLQIGWSFEGLKILYVSNENSAYEVMPKLDAFYGGFNPIKFRTREWTDKDRQKLKTVEHITKSIKGSILVPSMPALTTIELLNYIEETKPDIVVVDGVYLMNDSNRSVITHEDAAGVSRGLKRIARKLEIPIIGVIQANREAEGDMVGRKSIAHTDAYLQDADSIISVNKDLAGVVTGQVIKSRWGATSLIDTFKIEVDFENMELSFTEDSKEIKVLDDKDW